MSVLRILLREGLLRENTQKTRQLPSAVSRLEPHRARLRVLLDESPSLHLRREPLRPESLHALGDGPRAVAVVKQRRLHRPSGFLTVPVGLPVRDELPEHV